MTHKRCRGPKTDSSEKLEGSDSGSVKRDRALTQGLSRRDAERTKQGRRAMSAPAADDEVGTPAISSEGGGAMMTVPSKHARGGNRERGGKDRAAATAGSDKEKEGDSDSSSDDGSSDDGEVGCWNVILSFSVRPAFCPSAGTMMCKPRGEKAGCRW